MSAGVLEREGLSLGQGTPVEMPPMDVVRCRCNQSCPLSGQCEREAEGEDLLCALCREAKEKMERQRAGLFSAKGWLDSHCHSCDPEFDSEYGDDNADDS